MKNFVVGQKIGNRYEIVEALARGDGRTRYYKARDPNLRRDVVLVVQSAGFHTGQEFQTRFVRNAQVLANLRHPHIAQVYDFNVHADGFCYLVTEFVNGRTLQNILQELAQTGQRLPLDQTVRIATEVSEALAYAHSQGILHGGITPDKIIIAANGRAILSEFGLSKLMRNPSTSITATETTIGTPNYLSPEQIRGKLSDERSDIYALGVVLYQMVAGTVPFEADTPLSTMMAHVHEPVPPIKDDAVPDFLQGAIVYALAKAPEDRWQTADMLNTALKTQSSGTGAVFQVVGTDIPTISLDQPSIRLDERPSPPKPITVQTPTEDVEEKTDGTTDANPPPEDKGLIKSLKNLLNPLFGAKEPEWKWEQLRLDVATPPAVQVGRAFEIAIAIRQLASSILQEAGLDQVKSQKMQVSWPTKSQSIKLRLLISAPDCDLVQPERFILLHYQQDTPPIYFQLIARTEGRISILVTVYQDKTLLGNARIHTSAEQHVGEVEMTLSSYPLQVSLADRKLLLKNLQAAFSREELEELCFLVGLDADNFSSRKHKLVVEMVEACVREGRLRDLVEAGHQQRPHLSWQLESLPDWP